MLTPIRLLLVLFLFCLTVTAGTTHAAEILTGSVMLPRGAAGGAVVYLDGPGLHAAPLPKAIVDQRDKVFSPHVSVVTRGTTVRFPNDDSVFHNVFAYFQAKKFDLGMYPRGASKSVTFDKTGLVVLLCSIHSYMSAYIMVVDTPCYAVCDGKGHFRLPPVPPGTYILSAWHESGATLTRTVTVGGANTPLAFMLAKH